MLPLSLLVHAAHRGRCASKAFNGYIPFPAQCPTAAVPPATSIGCLCSKKEFPFAHSASGLFVHVSELLFEAWILGSCPRHRVLGLQDAQDVDVVFASFHY